MVSEIKSLTLLGTSPLVIFLRHSLSNFLTLSANFNGFSISFHEAAQHGEVRRVRDLLLSSSPSIDAMNNSGLTALTLASSSGQHGIAAILLENGADINFQDNDGWTALMEACRGGHHDVVSFLIENGAALNLQNKWGGTALMVACCSGHSEIASLLLEKGAYFSITNQDGKTALDLARENKKSKCVTLLEKFQKRSNEETVAQMQAKKAKRENSQASNHPPHLKEEPQEPPLAPQPSRSLMTEPLVDGDQLCSLETAPPPPQTEEKRLRQEEFEERLQALETIVSKDQQEISAVAASLSNLDTKLGEQGAKLQELGSAVWWEARE